uniref:Protein kinase domain-containing protein n=1 Tax=Eptatretus burgeri TaxID=7764 RepID=A0A8C4N610_EPTBU
MTLPGQCGKTEMEGRRLENAVNKRVKPPLPKKPTIPAKLACGGLDNQLKGVHPKSKATGVTQAYNNNNSQIVNEVDTKGMKQNCNSIGGDKYLVNEDRTNSSADHESHNGIAAGPSLHVGFVGGGDIGGGVRKDDLTLPEDEQSWWKIESENVSFVKSEVGIQPESDSPVSDNCAVGQCSGDSGVDSDERHGSKCWRAGTAAGKASSNAIQARLPSSVSDDVELLSHSDSRDSFSGEELHGAGPPPHPPVFGSAQPCAGPIEMKVQRCEVTPNAHVLNNIITDNKAYTTVNLEEESGGFQCAVVQGPVEVREASRKAVVELFSSSSKTGSVKKGAFGSEDNLESTSFSLICCTADGSGSKVMEGLNSRVPCLGPQEKAEMRFFDIGGGSGTNGGVPPFPVELSVEPLYAQSRKKKTNEKGKMTEVNVTPQTGAYDNMVNSCGDNTTDCSEEPVLDYLALTDKDDYDSTSPEHVYETLGRKGNLYSGVEQHAPIASKTAKSSLGKPGASGLVQPLVNDEFSIYAEVVDQKEPPTKEPMLKPYASQSDCPRRLVDASDRSTSSSTTPVEPLVLPAILQGSVSTGAEQDEPAEPPPRTTGSLGFGAHFQRKFSSRIKSKAGSAKAENCGSSLSSVTSSRPDENVVREGNVRHKLRRWQSLRVFFRWRRPEDETTKARQTCDKKQTLEGKLWSQSTESGLSVKTERNTESLPSLQIPITSSSNTSFSNASETRIAMVPVHSSTSNPPNSTPQPTISSVPSGEHSTRQLITWVTRFLRSLAPTKRSLQAPDDAEPYLINRGQGLDHGEKPQANREVPILREAQGRGQPGQAPGSEGGSNTEGSTGVMTEIYSNIGMGRACMVPPKHPRQRDQPEAAWPSPKTSPPLAPALIRLKPNQLPASELELNQSPSKLPQNLLKHCNTESVKNTLAPEVSARLATPMSVTTEANNSEVSTVQPSLIFSDVWDTTAVSERIRCLHLTALKSFAAKYQVMFEEQRPVLHNVCWKDFSLLSETPICSTTSGTYFRASCTKDIQRPYTLKFCHSTSVGNPTPPLRDNSSHFNIQHVASFFHTDTLAHSEANRPAGKQIARRLVLASADVPTQTLADFIRTTSHFHRAHPDIYEKQTCLLLLQLSSAVEHKVYGSLSQDNMDPDALLLSMPMGLVSQSPACQDPPDSACLPRILIEAGHGTPQRVSKTKVADAQNAPEFYIGVLVYQLLHLPNPFADSSYEDVANDLPPIPRLSIYSPGLEKLARLLLAPTGHIPATEACTVLRCLLWGPRDEMLRVLSSQSRIGSNKQCAVALRNWRDIKCTLLLMKLAEMALEPGASGISLEDWLCLQYLTTSSTDDISRATFLLQQG